ncbi:hypothetical protein Tco_0052426 [Tanacetum coccineum]
MSVLHCMMMSHDGELLALYRNLLKAYNEHVQSVELKLKDFEEKVAGMAGLEHQVSSLKRQVLSLNDKLSTSDASFTKSKAKGKERKKKIKSLTKSLDNLNAEVVHLSADLNRATILEAERDEEILRLKATPPEFTSFSGASFKFWSGSSLLSMNLAGFKIREQFAAILQKIGNFVPCAQGRLVKASPLVAQTDYALLNKIFEYAAKPLSVILQLEPEKLARPANLPYNVAPAPFVAAPEHNEELINAEVDGSDPKMTNDVTFFEPKSVFMQGISFTVDDAMELVDARSERVSSSPSNVVVVLSAGESGSEPLSAADEEDASNPSVV